jgi:hypothetical protein
MKRAYVALALGAALVLSLGSGSRAADVSKSKPQLAKAQRTIDNAVGILDAGKVQHAVFNDGRLSTWDYRPSIPAAFYKGWSYIPDLSMLVGVPEGPWNPMRKDPDTGREFRVAGPSVSAEFNADDWGPKAGSLGLLHSGDVTVADVYPGSTLGSLPLMATSTLPQSWPKDENGNRKWPGPWAVDPFTGEVLVGQFTADKEIFFAMTDYDLNNNGVPYAESDGLLDQGYALGIEMDMWVLSYGRSYAEDFLFFVAKIINNSQWDYHGVYVGFYNDTDVPEYNLTTTINDRMDWMTYILSEYDPVNDTTYNYNMAFIYDYRYGTGDFPGPEYKVIPAIKLLETPLAPPNDGIDNDHDGIVDEPEGEQLGLTDWHWFEWEYRPGQVDNTRTELITYKVISGDTSGLKPEEDAAYFWPDPQGHLNPHFDSPEGIQQMYPNGLDCVFIMSSGPFDLPAHDTTTFAFCLLMGDDLEDAKFNARTAQLMYELNYLGADPPKPPHVVAVPGDGKVTLYWDRSAEESVDIMTRYRDFEGYKIYKTTSPPVNNEWGQKIYDGQGQEVGFIPVAQFDLKDGITGLDPQYPHLDRGKDTGLQHSWTDYNVKNGVTYWYSVTSYDRGVLPDPQWNPDGWAPLNYLECAKGTNPGSDPNLVMVVPGPPASNYVGPEVKVRRLPGTLGNGPIRVVVVDEFAITGHKYVLSFDDSTQPGTLLYDVLDQTTGKEVVSNARELRGEEGPIFDGMRLEIINYPSLTVLQDSSGWSRTDGQPSQATWVVELLPATANPPVADYKIVFNDTGTVAFAPPNFRVPFKIINLVTGKVVDLGVFPQASTDTTAEMKNTWTSGDVINLREEGKFTYKVIIKRNPSSSVPNVPPRSGDVYRIILTKPFKAKRDRFEIDTTPFTVRQAVQSDLDKIRVVPNPYVVSAEWEIDPNLPGIHFTNLPSECTISIYTLAGEKVNEIHHRSATNSTESWNMLNFNQQEIAYGLYIYVVETPSGAKKVGKFSIIR